MTTAKKKNSTFDYRLQMFYTLWLQVKQDIQDAYPQMCVPWPISLLIIPKNTRKKLLIISFRYLNYKLYFICHWFLMRLELSPLISSELSDNNCSLTRSTSRDASWSSFRECLCKLCKTSLFTYIPRKHLFFHTGKQR